MYKRVSIAKIRYMYKTCSYYQQLKTELFAWSYNHD